MYFTQEDYRNIERWLQKRAVKDIQLSSADPISGTELVPIIQNNVNKTIEVREFMHQLSEMELPDFYNVSAESKKLHLTLDEAISLVPVNKRKLGLTVTYHNLNGNWVIYQFKGDSIYQWDSPNYWDSIFQEAIEENIPYPDEEDITGIRDGNRTFLKLKDKEYNPDEFSGLGKIILRKNLVPTDSCSVDDEDHFVNVLTQSMIDQPNTIYIVQYDFDLNGRTIAIPKNSTIWFQGGTINNGTIYLTSTSVVGVTKIEDMGNVSTFGLYRPGQMFLFRNKNYKSKKNPMFVQAESRSAYDTRKFIENDSAYETIERDELRWWNGRAWLRILDITDYNEIKSIISDIINKHNSEMAMCYEYFESEVERLTSSIQKNKESIDNHTTIIANMSNEISSIEGSIEDIEDGIGTINNNINTISEDLDESNRKIEENKASIGSLNSDVSDLRDLIQTENSEINNEITRLNSQVGTLDTNVSKLKKAHDIDINNLNTKIVEINNNVSDNLEAISNLEDRVSSVEENISELNNDMSTVKTGININANGIYNNQLAIEELRSSMGDIGNINVEPQIKEFLDNEKYVKSVSLNGSSLVPADSRGQIVLPDYPTSVEHADEADVSLHAEEAECVTSKLIFKGAVNAEYNGHKEVTVTIPSAGATPTDNNIGSEELPVVIGILEAQYTGVEGGWLGPAFVDLKGYLGKIATDISSFNPTKGYKLLEVAVDIPNGYDINIMSITGNMQSSDGFCISGYHSLDKFSDGSILTLNLKMTTPVGITEEVVDGTKMTLTIVGYIKKV